MGISADLKFSSEGGTLQSDEGGDEYKYTYRGNYIRLPLQGIYFFGELGDKVRPKVSLGPSFGFLVGGKSKLEVNGTKTDEADSKDAFTRFDIGLNAAAGANFRIGTNKWLNTDITYYHGFSNVFEDAGEKNKKVRNRGLGINIGITFPLGTVKPD
ncbi:MAG: porin family protein [Bacteroidota bacterium]